MIPDHLSNQIPLLAVLGGFRAELSFSFKVRHLTAAFEHSGVLPNRPVCLWLSPRLGGRWGSGLLCTGAIRASARVRWKQRGLVGGSHLCHRGNLPANVIQRCLFAAL